MPVSLDSLNTFKPQSSINVYSPKDKKAHVVKASKEEIDEFVTEKQRMKKKSYTNAIFDAISYSLLFLLIDFGMNSVTKTKTGKGETILWNGLVALTGAGISLYKSNRQKQKFDQKFIDSHKV